jgi:LPXTG-motif cell wall-anchored protein
MLPETGAMGTAMFITFGMFVMLGTGILLVTKKRMSMIED